MKKILQLVLIFLLPLAAHVFAAADTISYQGKLSDINGPITGTVAMSFGVYDFVTNGTLLYEEDHGAVNVVSGVYSVEIGGGFSTNAGLHPNIQTAILSSNPLWLQVSVNNDVLSPRTQITAVATAISAEESDFAGDADTLDGSHAYDLEESAEIDALFSLHKSEPFIHHQKTNSFTELNDTILDSQVPDTITIEHAATASDADTLDGIDSSELAIKTTLAVAGSGTTVNWANLINMPADFADGTDDIGAAGLAGSGTQNYLSKFTGAESIGDSQIVDDGNNVGIGTSNPTAKLDVETVVLSDNYSDWTYYNAWMDSTQHSVDTCDNNFGTAYICPEGQSLNCEDLREISGGDEWEYRFVQCDPLQQAARFGGHVSVTGNLAVIGTLQGSSFIGNGSGLYNVTATTINVDCPLNSILLKTASGWACTSLPLAQPICQDGDFVNCYEGSLASRGVGACLSGTRTCSSGFFGSCENQVLPTQEDCDLQNDADCDGNSTNYSKFDAPGCQTYYPDTDNDLAGNPNGPTRCACTVPNGYVQNSDDCNDSNYFVGPITGDFHTEPIEPNTTEYDWNCDGLLEGKFNELGPSQCVERWDPTLSANACVNLNEAGPDQGWSVSDPGCGNSGGWSFCTYASPGVDCQLVNGFNTQACK